MARSPQQRELNFRTWGGRRSGAGRKPSRRRRNVVHRARDRHEPRHPVHVTLRAQASCGSLRAQRVFPVVQAALRAGTRGAFRVIAFSVQADHVHLVVESDTSWGLGRGLQGLAIRIAKAVNRTLGRRGAVWSDRYHARALATPRAVRHAFVYVLQNFRKHVAGARGIDPCSSAPWFLGWKCRLPAAWAPAPVASPRTWLARIGWRRHGLLGLREGPVMRRRR